MAKFVVVGAGIVGVCTAYELVRRGHAVTLVDQNDEPCQGSSARNGAQLSYAYCDALASPTLLSHLIEIVLRRDPAYRVHLQADPEFLLWCLRFILNASSKRFSDNTRYLLTMAAASQSAMTELLRKHDLRFSYAVAGKMILHSTHDSFAGAKAGYRLKTSLGFPLQLLNREEAMAIEPALSAYRDPIAGVVFSPEDAVGQPHLFCQHLLGLLQREYGLELRLGKKVNRLATTPGRSVRTQLTGGEVISFDGAVICTGHTSGIAARYTGFGASWPVQGYSMTVPARADAMRVSITDMKRRIVFARIGSHIRIAGIADIGGRRVSFDDTRFGTLRKSALEAFAGCYEIGPMAQLEPWTGARPMTPSSRPIVRRADRGIYLNLGHGALGWTLALGSAAKLGELIAADFHA
ncbi:FAD-dependent oxidoreductase [Sinorhizobium meliloti]|uniref:FAD-dependent oxidoreductase n=1 Tax=Rhizobium meliloti TaxID=382 RepID=UPI0004A364B0|nr:FAD-dependent oxidoreductase [Sinorhizobium meliloti]